MITPGELNLSWRMRRFEDDCDHLYVTYTPTILCTGEKFPDGAAYHQMPDPDYRIVGYLHPPNFRGTRQDISDPTLDTPINECPDCQNLLTMMELSE